jgi:hypothetical protein
MIPGIIVTVHRPISLCCLLISHKVFFMLFFYLVQGVYVTFYLIFFISYKVFMSHFILYFYLVQGVYVTFYLIFLSRARWLCHILSYLFISYKVFMSHFILSFYLVQGVYVTFYLIFLSRTRCLCHILSYLFISYKVFMSHFVLYILSRTRSSCHIWCIVLFRDRPFNLQGGVMVFCFVQKYVFGQHKS